VVHRVFGFLAIVLAKFAVTDHVPGYQQDGLAQGHCPVVTIAVLRQILLSLGKVQAS
jgi:hypothetical protein